MVRGSPRRSRGCRARGPARRRCGRRAAPAGGEGLRSLDARAVPLEACQDSSRLEDGDRSPETGGMGGSSPRPFLDAAGSEAVMSRIVARTLAGVSSDGISYRGVLYVGLMLTSSGPTVLEFN